jgi:hypothetical protein
MASDDKKTTKTDAAPKDAAPKKAAAAETKTATGAEPAKPEAKPEGKAEVGEKAADVAASYSRGEGQKPVTKAYKENWNAIFGKKKKNRSPHERSDMRGYARVDWPRISLRSIRATLALRPSTIEGATLAGLLSLTGRAKPLLVCTLRVGCW